MYVCMYIIYVYYICILYMYIYIHHLRIFKDQWQIRKATFVLFFTNRSRPGMHAFSAAGADKADIAGTWSHLFRSMIDLVWRCKCGFIICHDVSSFKQRLADHPPTRPAYSTKRNMPGLVWCLEAEHGFGLPGWEWGDGMGAILTTLGSCASYVCWKWLAASFRPRTG